MARLRVVALLVKGGMPLVGGNARKGFESRNIDQGGFGGSGAFPNPDPRADRTEKCLCHNGISASGASSPVVDKPRFVVLVGRVGPFVYSRHHVIPPPLPSQACRSPAGERQTFSTGVDTAVEKESGTEDTARREWKHILQRRAGRSFDSHCVPGSHQSRGARGSKDSRPTQSMMGSSGSPRPASSTSGGSMRSSGRWSKTPSPRPSDDP